MNAVDLARLQQDLRAAEDVACEAAKDAPDGGSCCRDAVFLRVGLDCSVKRKSKAIDDVVGSDSYIRTRWWRGYLLNIGVRYGQASRRTKAVEAATAFLKERGWDVCTFYAVD